MTSVKVVCRVRPESEKEKAGDKDPEFCIKYSPEGQGISVWDSASRNPVSFAFDRVFSPESGVQSDVYAATGQEIIRGCFDGFNGCIFAYGQTGSGKTYTMFGKASEGVNDPELLGVIPRVARDMFDIVGKAKEDLTYCEITCSFLEIYMENIRDLLNPAASEKQLQVHESKDKGVFVTGLVEQASASSLLPSQLTLVVQSIECEQDIMDVIAVGDRNRTFRSTAMNAHSSRSHSVLMINIGQKYESGETKSSKLNLVDLAGSERLSRTLVGEEGKKEGIAINLSLSTLGLCIHALTIPGKFVPYRDSVLTRILKESLGGNSRTTLIICASPHHSNGQDTISTLRFGSRAKDIKLKVKCNVQRSPAQLEKLIAEMEKEVRTWVNKNLALERQIEWVKCPNYDPAAPIPPEYLVAGSEGGASTDSDGKAQTAGTSESPESAGSSGGQAKQPPRELPGTLTGMRDAIAEAKERKAQSTRTYQDQLLELVGAEEKVSEEIKRLSCDTAPVGAQGAAAKRAADDVEARARHERERNERELEDLRRQASEAEGQCAELRAQNAELHESSRADEDAIVALDADNEKANEERTRSEAALAEAKARTEELLRASATMAAEAQEAASALSKLQTEHARLFDLSARAQRAIDATTVKVRAGTSDVLQLQSALGALERRLKEVSAQDADIAAAQSDMEKLAASAAESLEQAREPLARHAGEKKALAIDSLTRALSGIADLRSAAPDAAKDFAQEEERARRLLSELDPSFDFSKPLPQISSDAMARQLRDAIDRAQTSASESSKLVAGMQERALAELTRQAELAAKRRSAAETRAREALEEAEAAAVKRAELERKRKEQANERIDALAKAAAESTAAARPAAAAVASEPADVATLLARTDAEEQRWAKLRAREDEEARMRQESRSLLETLEMRYNDLTQRRQQEEATQDKAKALFEREAKRAASAAVEAGLAETAVTKAAARLAELKAQIDKVTQEIAAMEGSLGQLQQQRDTAILELADESDLLDKAKEDLHEQQQRRLDGLKRSARIRKSVQRRPGAGGGGNYTKVNISKLPSALRSTRSKLLLDAAMESERSQTPRGEGSGSPYRASSS
eukprot:m51a1_g3158 putative kinesin heavy chain (1100) ;mRNA; r:353669-357500